jgi:hypothetical protein
MTYVCHNPASGMTEPHTALGVGIWSGAINPRFAEECYWAERKRREAAQRRPTVHQQRRRRRS